MVLIGELGSSVAERQTPVALDREHAVRRVHRRDNVAVLPEELEVVSGIAPVHPPPHLALGTCGKAIS